MFDEASVRNTFRKCIFFHTHTHIKNFTVCFFFFFFLSYSLSALGAAVEFLEKRVFYPNPIFANTQNYMLITIVNFQLFILPYPQFKKKKKGKLHKKQKKAYVYNTKNSILPILQQSIMGSLHQQHFQPSYHPSLSDQ